MGALGRLTALQGRILERLADLAPPFTLVGGAALAGFHLEHRETRDLDLFWRERSQLGKEPDAVRERLRSAGLEVSVVQRAPAFVRLRVADTRETVVVDLVADPGSALEDDESHTVGVATVRVATRHDIFVSKLCVLLGRAELRDLVDVRALLESEGDLERAVGDAPRIDGGFSALTLAWVLQGLPIEQLGRFSAASPHDLAELSAFRDEMVERLLTMAKPDRPEDDQQ